MPNLPHSQRACQARSSSSAAGSFRRSAAAVGKGLAPQRFGGRGEIVERLARRERARLRFEPFLPQRLGGVAGGPQGALEGEVAPGGGPPRVDPPLRPSAR